MLFYALSCHSNKHFKAVSVEQQEQEILDCVVIEKVAKFVYFWDVLSYSRGVQEAFST